MPPGAAAAGSSLPAGLKVHQAAFVISAAAQLVVLLRQMWDRPLFSPAVAAVAASSLVQVSAAALLLKCPLVYWKNRSWILSLLRIAIFILPNSKRANVGLARMLDHSAHLGLHGAVKDWSRIFLGIRLVSSAVVPLVLPQRPLLTMTTQTVLLWLISNAPGYCTCKLLTEPLSRQRMQRLAAGMDLATVPLLAVAPSGVLWSTGAAEVSEGR
jgi:hypothetical protein